MEQGQIKIGVAWINKTGYANIYIGKGSPLGNQFAFSQMTQSERDVVCDKFYGLFTANMKHKSSEMYEEVKRLFEMANSGIDINLQCYCKDKDLRCHGETIKEYLDMMLTKYRTNPKMVITDFPSRIVIL